MEKKSGGYLVISLDFELHWGMFDKVTIDAYGDHYIGVRQAIPELLALFSEHGVHATWATVGMLMCESKDELLAMLPPEPLRPRYRTQAISAYSHIATAHIGKNEKEDPYHFAPSLVEEIVAMPGQELASHTFSHYYCLDGVENPEKIFEADLAQQQKQFQKFGVVPTSIVFPRNQVTDSALESCAKYGITAYRGTESHHIYQPRRDDRQSVFVRARRLLDAYVDLTGPNTTHLSTVEDAGLYNIPASRFLRPYHSKLQWCEKRRMRRIKEAMTYAAQHNEIFHLWWHPHNFGTNRKANMDNLRALINHFATLEEAYGMQSRNMQEIATTAATPTKT